MAIVNIDLSEYDAIRSRNKELEKRVEQLEENLKGAENGSKVIVREVAFRRTYSRIDGDLPLVRDQKEIISESYVNFEDVRLRIEEKMKKDIVESIEMRKESAKSYENKESNLRAEYTKKKSELDAEYKKKESELRASIENELNEAKEKANKLDAQVYELQRKLQSIRSNASSFVVDAVNLLEARFFKPTHAISLLKEFINRTNV